jgi:CRP-like cAMP-binding protein
LERDTFHDILEDDFSIIHGLIRTLAKRTLEVRQRIPTGTHLVSMEGLIQPPDRPLDLVERIVMIRRPDSPFGRSSLDALAQMARATPEVRLEAKTRPRWYTAVTETPLVALRGDTESLLDVLEDHFDLSIGLVEAMARRVIDIRRESAARG